jgi:predicted alpha/beta superfamily hydrolase
MMKKLILCLFLLAVQTLVFAQVTVTFKTGAIAPFKTTPKGLFIAGNFNNWNPADTTWKMQPGEQGSYLLTKVLAKGYYKYKLTKGSWGTVECTSDGKNVDDRSFTLLHDTTIIVNAASWQDDHPAQQRKHTASANVHIISENFDIPQLNRQRRVWIYLPADYATSHKKYPVIYMHDGQNLFDEYTSGYGEWGVDEIMDKMPVKEQCIIVGIDHGGDYRITEYDPYDSKYGKGRGDDYVDFLAKTLKPYIDKHYRTKKDAKHTTIVGSSMGGLISMYAALKYPHVFGNAGIFSPAFWIAAPDIYKYAAQKNARDNTRFYFVCGDIESDSMVADMQKMVDTLRSEGWSKENTPEVIVNGAIHNEKQWNGDFPAFYNWLIHVN